MLKLIRFCAVWIKIRILLLLFDNRAFFCTFCDKHSFCGTSKCSSIREEDTNFLQKKKNQHLRSTYLNPDVRHCDAMHTTLSLVHNVSKEETKRNRRLYFFYRSKNVVTYQHRASKISFIYVRYFMSVPI